MKTAVLGLWHVHAEGYFKTCAQKSDVIGVYDTDSERLKSFCEKHNVPAFGTFEELLKSEAEGVIVCTSTSSHVDYMIKLAGAKKHIFTEKVLALTSEDCEKISEAVRQNKVDFVISYPQKSSGINIYVKNILESGTLGKINYLRFRNVHSGSIKNWLPSHFYNKQECGGGAMIDLGAHGMYLIDWFLGEPDGYNSIFTVSYEASGKNLDKVEDNAVTVMTYKNGCIAINETGFVSSSYPMSLEIGGENGYFRWDSKVGITFVVNGKPREVIIPPNNRDPLESFLNREIPNGCTINDAIRLTKMMERAYAASDNTLSVGRE